MASIASIAPFAPLATPAATYCAMIRRQCLGAALQRQRRMELQAGCSSPRGTKRTRERDLLMDTPEPKCARVGSVGDGPCACECMEQ